MALYPYTLQPIALNLSEAEFYQAQYELFNNAAPSFGLKSLKMKEWIIIAVVVILAIAGLVFLTGYSTIIFWLMLVSMPDEMRQMKLGVQKHGLIMVMPVNQPDLMQNPKMRGMQMRMGSTQQGVIPWSDVKSWDETDDFIFMMFEMKGQQASQIIPKRLQAQKFPINTVRQHLQEVVPIKGLQTEGLQRPN